MLGVLPKSQGIAEKKMTSQTQDHLFLVIVFSLYLFLFFSFFFMLFPNPAVLFLHHPVRFPVLSLLACLP